MFFEPAGALGARYAATVRPATANCHAMQMHESRRGLGERAMHALLRFCAATMMEPLHFGLWTGGLWLAACAC